MERGEAMGFPALKQSNKESAVNTIKKAGESWPSTFVARSRVPDFTGGLLSVGTMANRDSDGTGVKGAFRIGRQVCYPVDSLCEWLIKRLEM
jgi:hypothetical protein